MSRPGSSLRAFAARLFDARTMARVVDPAIADLQHQPSVDAYVAVLKVLSLCAAEEITMTAQEWTADDRRTLTRALAAIAIVTVLAALGSVAPFLWYVFQPDGVDRRVALYLMPHGVPGALIVAVTLGTLFALDGRPLSARANGRLLAVALFASVLSFADIAWLTPAGNQAFQAAAAGKPHLVRVDAALGELWQFASGNSSFNAQLRIALGVAPLVMAVVAMAIVRMKRASRWTAGVAALVAIVGYYILLYSARSLADAGSLSPFAAAWLPNLVFATTGVGLMLSRRGETYVAAG